MPETQIDCPALPAPRLEQVEQVVEHLAGRYAGSVDLHRDVIEAAVRSGWAKYEGARVTTYRAILAERAAEAALRQWFGAPGARPPDLTPDRPRQADPHPAPTS